MVSNRILLFFPCIKHGLIFFVITSHPLFIGFVVILRVDVVINIQIRHLCFFFSKGLKNFSIKSITVQLTLRSLITLIDQNALSISSPFCAKHTLPRSMAFVVGSPNIPVSKGEHKGDQVSHVIIGRGTMAIGKEANPVTPLTHVATVGCIGKNCFCDPVAAYIVASYTILPGLKNV